MSTGTARRKTREASRNISKCGYLFVAPDWDFNVSVNRTKRWQRRWFVLYDDGELTYSLDEFPDTIPQGTIDMNKVLDVSDAENVTGNDFAISITTPDKVHFIKGTSKEESKWWFDVFQKVLPRHLSRGKHKRNATFPCGKATIPNAAVITQDYCSEDDIRLNNYSRPKFLSSSDILRDDKEWIESVDAEEDEDVFPVNNDTPYINDDSDGESKRDVEVHNALNKLISQSEELENESEGLTNHADIKMPKDCLSQLEELDARRRNRRYLKRENRVQRNQRSRNDGVSKMIPAKKSPDKSEVLESPSSTNGSAMAAAEKLEYLESIHSNDDRSSYVKKSNEKENSQKETSDPVIRISNPSGKTNLRKSESLKNIPSESQSEIRDHVTALRRYHSFKGSSSHRKVKASGAASILKKAKLSSSSTPRTSANTAVTVSPPVPSDMKTNAESSNLSSDNSPEHSPEGVFTRTGWLMRQTFNKDWSRHWFVLRDSSLTYYRDPSAEHCGIMDGILDLNQVSSIREADSDRYYAFNLLMWDGKKMVLATETDDFRKMWIQALHYASNLWSSASKEDFICSEIVLPEHNFHHSERISSPSSLSSLPYVYNSTMTETSSSSDDQSEYFSLVDEDEVSDLSSSPRTLPPSPPINRNMMSLVKEKSRIRSTCGQKTSTPIDDITTNSNHDNQAEPVYHKDNLGINEEEEEEEADIDEIAHRLMNGDHTVSPSKLQDESLDHLLKVKENMKFRLDFGDQFSKKGLNKEESTFETPDVSFGKSSPCGNSDVSTPNSEAAIECSVCLRVKSKLAAAKDEIRKLKEELKEAYANFDNLEMRSYKLAQDLKVKEENYSSQIALMTAKIDDLTSKFSLAEKNYRQLKQKTMKNDGKERKRSSLKNKEGLTLTKEYELKLCDLEKKIANIESTILKESTASNNSSKQSMQETITSSESIDNGASAESPSSNTKGLFSRLQSLGSKVQNVNNLVSENSHSSKEINSPEIRLEVRDNIEPNIIDEASDDYWAVSLDKSLKSLNKYLEGHPANLSECQSVFIRKMNKILKWLKTSLDNICKQGSRENNLANEKNLLVQNIIDLLTSLCIETPKDSEGPKQAKTCYALLMAFESMRLLERVDCVDSIDSLVKFDITECAFKVIIKTLCLVFAEYENTEISTILQLISRIPQIRFFCPMVNKLLPQSQEEDEQFSTVSERLQLLNDQRSFILTSLEEAKKVRHQSLCNTLIEVPVKDVNISRPETINSIEQYITSIALDIHQIAELQLSGMQNQSSFLLQEEQDKIRLWCLEANKAIKNSFKAFMNELTEECPMVHESTISLFDLSDATRLEITSCVTELSFICVSYTLLNMLLSDAIPGESVVENVSTKSLPSPNYIDNMWEKFESSKSNFLSNPGFFECLQCTLLNNLLSGPNQNINWVDYIKKYNVYNPRKSERLNFLTKYRGTNVSSTCNNCDKFSTSSTGNSKDACNNVTCTECEKWIKKFCTSEKQHELERQALESKYTRELQQLEECLTKSNEYEEQIQTLKDLYEQKLQFDSDQIHEDSIRETYKNEIEDLKEMFKKGLVAIENSHYRITTEMEKKHKDEISILQAEKEKALELEAQATITALEVIKRSHEQQLKEETTLMKEDLMKKFQNSDHDSFYCKYRSDLENLKAEIVSITEKYSEKCLENISLEEKVNSLRHQLEEAHDELCILLKKNKEIDPYVSNI
ncbi:protein outspread [Trichonephila clavata]|uniref:Protein outspread n=1 Tax=Trichonephila clavata TaxID=2740835 RepID=A0A8X6FBT4_TRICU|nr:protein outspread [Trichonephila clavata]